MYPHSDGGYRQFPGLVEFAEYSEPTTNNDYVVLSEVTTPLAHAFNKDGDLLVVLDTSGTGYVYNASNFVPTTYTGNSYDFTAEDINPVDVLFYDNNADPLMMLGADGVSYYSYIVSSAGVITYTSVSTSIPGTSGTLSSFFTKDGKDWVFNATASYHHTSAAYETTLTLQSTGSAVAFWDSTGTLTIDESASSAGRLLTPYDVSTRYVIGPCSGLSNASGVPAGGRTNRSYSTSSDTLFAEVSKHTSTGDVIFQSWTLSNFNFSRTGEFLGADVMGGIPYINFNGSLLEFDASGDFLAWGNGQNSQSWLEGDIRSVVDTDGTNLVFTNGEYQYQFNRAAGISEITDADLGDAFTNAYLDSAFYYEIGGFIYSSEVGDPDSVEPLHFINAESFTDDITRLFALNRLLYAFGDATTEIYFVSGQGNTRLTRQAVLEHGIIGRYAVDSIDDTIYFLDAERRLSRIRGLEYAPVNVPGLGEEFDSYATVDDCIVSAYTFEQENFIEVSFPTQDVTWTVHEPSGEIVKREDSSGDRSRAADYLKAYGKTFLIDHTNSKIFELSGSVYQDDGSNVTRTLYSQNVTSETLGSADRGFTLNAMYIDYDTSASADIDVSISKDGGATFGTARTITVNGRGTTRLSSWGMASDVIVKIETSANARVDILGLSVEPEGLDD
mgnify:CR=1 FL=1